jgi:hypothetical protein
MGRWHGNGSDGVMGIVRLDLDSIHLITRHLKIEERDLNVYTSELSKETEPRSKRSSISSDRH